MLKSVTFAGPACYQVVGSELAPIGGLLDLGCQYLEVGLASTERQTRVAGSVQFLHEEVLLGGASTT